MLPSSVQINHLWPKTSMQDISTWTKVVLNLDVVLETALNWIWLDVYNQDWWLRSQISHLWSVIPKFYSKLFIPLRLFSLFFFLHISIALNHYLQCWFHRFEQTQFHSSVVTSYPKDSWWYHLENLERMLCIT